MSRSFYKVLVPNNYARRVIMSLLNSDSDITNEYKFADYDNVVDEQCGLIGSNSFYKLELAEIQFEHVKVPEQNLATFFFYKAFIASIAFS